MSIIAKIKKLNRQRNLKTKVIKRELRTLASSIGYRKHTSLMPGKYNSVCVFMHTQAIGDAVVTSGFINAMIIAEFKVYVVIPERLLFLFPTVINVDGVIVFDKNDKDNVKNKLGNLRIDLVVDFSDYDTEINYREKSLKYINPHHAIGFNQPKISMFDTNVIANKAEHISGRMIDVLSLLGVSIGFKTSLCFDDVNFSKGHNFANGIDEKILILNPYGSQDNRCLSDYQIGMLLEYLSNVKGYKVIVFNMGKDISYNSYENIIMNPFSDPGNSFALLSHADVVITVDTGIVHLCSAFNVKQYCIYNNRLFNGKYDNNTVWGPNSDKAMILTTDEMLNTELGDDMTKFDINKLISALCHDFSIEKNKM